MSLAWRAAVSCFPRRSLRSWQHRLVFLGRFWVHRERLRGWALRPSSAALSRALVHRPSLIGAIEAPYLNSRWSVDQRLDAIEGHYRLVTSPDLAFLDIKPQTRLPLATLDDLRPGLYVAVDQVGWLMQEGELVMSLFLGSRRIYALAFTLGDPDGERITWIGAVQGLPGAAARFLYRDLARRAHGVRPRELLLEAFRVFASTVGVRHILGVDNGACQRRARYFARRAAEVHLDYEAMWHIQGGRAIGGGFCELPVGPRRRRSDQIPSRKRAQYRRRYVLLEALAADIEAAVERARE